MEVLAERVAETSKGQFRLIDTPDRGRCLEATVDLPAGHRIRDLPILPHGSSVGRHLAEATESSEDIKSVELLAALDFLASMVLAGSHHSHADLLMSLYEFEGAPPRVPMIRRWHKKWKPAVAAALDISLLEKAWAHVVPNWRQLTVSAPCWRLIDSPAGLQEALSHDIVCGLWLHMALCEHSCDPNCALLHDGESLWFTALRPISAGSPITTSYLSVGGLLRTRAERQEELRETWGFDCACPRCTSEAGQAEQAEQAEAEEGLGGLGDLETLLRSCSSPPEVFESPESQQEYCQNLCQLQKRVRQLHGTSSPSPAELALLLLEAIFAEPEQDAQDATERHWLACLRILGDSSAYTRWASQLLNRPQDCLDRDVQGSDSRTESQTVATARGPLREAYARHFASRRWARRRRGAEFVAWADTTTDPS